MIYGISLVDQLVRNLPSMHETWVWSLGWEDSLEEGIATLSSIVGGESPWTEEPDRLQSMGPQRVRYDWATKHSTTQMIYAHNVYRHICIYAHLYMQIYVYVNMWIYVYMYMCIYAYMYMWIYEYMYRWIYVDIQVTYLVCLKMFSWSVAYF